MEAKKKKKILIIGFGVAATGMLSYFGYQYWKNRRAKKLEEQIEKLEWLKTYDPSWSTDLEGRIERIKKRK